MAINNESITNLDLTYRDLTELPDLSIYPNLKKLNCSNNKLISLDNLPNTIVELDCAFNKITSLDHIPPSLSKLSCNDNPLYYDFEPTLENIRKL